MNLFVDEELFNATKQGDIEKVKSALESGVSPNAEEGEHKRSLLTIAAEVWALLVFEKILILAETDNSVFLFFFFSRVFASDLNVEWSPKFGQVFG